MQIPRADLARRVRLTDSDHARISKCRRDHTRLGFAYQLAFVRLLGRFPRQHPLEIQEEVAQSVAAQMDLETKADSLLTRYAAQRKTIAEHAEDLRRYLGVRPFDTSERENLRRHLRGEAAHLDQPAGLVARAEEYLRREGILLPASSTLRRVVGEARAVVMSAVEQRIESALNSETRSALDALLVVDVSGGDRSRLQMLKEPPGTASPRALIAEIKKLETIDSTGALEVDLSWLRGSLRKALARRVRYSSAHRLRELRASNRYTALLSFLHETHADTIDHIVDLQSKLVTQTFRRAERKLDQDLKNRRRSVTKQLKSFRAIGNLVLDSEIADADLRRAVLNAVPLDQLKNQVDETHEWLTGKSRHVFLGVADRFNYFRKFSPSFLGRLSFETDPAGGSNQATELIETIDLLRELNRDGKRKVPPDAPVSFIPPSRRRFVEREGGIDRAAYEAAVMTALRDEVRRGNVAVRGSKRFGRLSELFMSEQAWFEQRDHFFELSGFPVDGREAVALLEQRLQRAFVNFLEGLPENASVTFQDDGGPWKLSTDPSEGLDDDDRRRLEGLHKWLEARMRRIRLPDLLIEVDNELAFSQHLTSGRRTAQQVCEAVAAVMAYGCNLGPHTMARLAKGVTYSQIKKVADWHLHEDTLRLALADVVQAISKLETTRVWGQGRTSSSDGQRFLFPRRTIKQTYSHRMNDYALEFYSFVADNYAPFYSTPIECTERDAAYVLDGLLYHESDLEIDEHYTDTHGYTECQFAAFAMLGKKFCPRIRGLHKQRIYRSTDDLDDYGVLAPMLSPRDRKLHLDWVVEQWDRIAQFFCSMATGYTTASVAMKRIHAFGGGNHFYRAVRELGRLFKTEFILNYLAQPALRQRVRRGLLKSEELNALARSIFYGKLGRADWRDFRRQVSTASCLTLIQASIVYWQIKEVERVVTLDAGEGADVDFDMLARISPVQWDNVTLYGSYDLRQEKVKL